MFESGDFPDKLWMPHRTQSTLALKTFENAAHSFLMWCYRDSHDGTKAGCTVIQRAKHIILLTHC